MKFSEKWLRQWVNPSVNTNQLIEALTLLGLKVEHCKSVASEFTGVIVAEVISCEPHPRAERLHFCRVNIGESQLVEVVCGAANVRQGLKVAFVKIGGRLPGNIVIKKVNLRGICSNGMICSSKELGMDEDSQGILELPLDAPVGVNVRDYLLLDDHIIDVEVTPNRGDCNSILGIARDVAAYFKLPITAPLQTLVSISHSESLCIHIIAKAQCPSYFGRVIHNINSQITTPFWMQRCLLRSGLQLIHPIVDIANYVMLEIGQPLHVFDLDKITKNIFVRFARVNENLLLLNSQKVCLQNNVVVIADDEKILAIAGVMGSISSAVEFQTKNIFVESAYFSPESIATSTRELGLMTDASYRFVRGVDFALQEKALERFTELLQTIHKSKPGVLFKLIAENYLPKRIAIPLHKKQILRILGIELSSKEVEDIFIRLGMVVSKTPSGWSVIPPSYRFDIENEVDLLEELIRIHGYDKLPSMVLETSLQLPDNPQLPYLRLPQLLTDLGYYEAITYSFVDPALHTYFDSSKEFLKLANPLSNDMSVMRTSLWPGLMKALQYNLHRQVPGIRLFEMGQCFILDDGKLTQCEKLAGIAAGAAHSLQWGQKDRSVDFFDIKGDIEQLFFAAFHGQALLSWLPTQHPALHPEQSAELFVAEKSIGFVGALHPKLVPLFCQDVKTFLFEINMDILPKVISIKYKNISKFPMVFRDLAIVIDESISAKAIEKNIKQSVDHLLHEVKIFDIYQGEGVEKGKKSVAVRLTFQDMERTLVDKEVNQMIKNVVSGLQQQFNAILRA